MRFSTCTEGTSWAGSATLEIKDLRFRTTLRHPAYPKIRVEYIQQEKSIWWVSGKYYHFVSILQAGTCQIISLAENPRCSQVWQ